MKNESISLNTKKALAEALKKAMRKKPFHKITVSELIQDCKINRKTFYYHFEDIYALLKWMLEKESIEVVKHFNLLVDYEEAITFVMDYVEENDHILNCAFDSIGRDELDRFFYADFLDISRAIIEQVEQRSGKTLDEGYKEFLSRFYASAVASVLTEWVKNREKRDRTAVINYLSATIRDSLTGIFQCSPYADDSQPRIG